MVSPQSHIASTLKTTNGLKHRTKPHEPMDNDHKPFKILISIQNPGSSSDANLLNLFLYVQQPCCPDNFSLPLQTSILIIL